MNIRVISSFTDDDEDRFASVLLKALVDLLMQMPITYSVRIKTTRGKTLQRSDTAPQTPPSTFTRREGANPGTSTGAHAATSIDNSD